MIFSLFKRPCHPARCLAALACLTCLPAVQAAPLTRDLGQGLGYHRAQVLPLDLPAGASRAQPRVLDLRFTVADDSAAAALQTWLESHAAPAAPVIVLVNAETAPSLHRALASLTSKAGFITVGTSTRDFVPDISIEISLEAERDAYDALERGTSVESLTIENTGKRRRDEAAIMRERSNPPEDIAEPELSDATPDNGSSHTPPSPSPVIDSALQRAIHLHRALLALERLG